MVHTVPADLKKALIAAPKAREAWNGLTPLARNEWICWVTYVKKAETRENHIKRVCAALVEGSAGLVAGLAVLIDSPKLGPPGASQRRSPIICEKGLPAMLLES